MSLSFADEKIQIPKRLHALLYDLGNEVQSLQLLKRDAKAVTNCSIRKYNF